MSYIANRTSVSKHDHKHTLAGVLLQYFSQRASFMIKTIKHNPIREIRNANYINLMFSINIRLKTLENYSFFYIFCRLQRFTEPQSNVKMVHSQSNTSISTRLSCLNHYKHMSWYESRIAHTEAEHVCGASLTLEQRLMLLLKHSGWIYEHLRRLEWFGPCRRVSRHAASQEEKCNY